MAIITDNKGTEWDLKLSLSAIRAICKKLNISLAQLTMLDLPIADILASVHYLCAKQLDKEKISSEAFYERIDDISVDDLLKALQDTFYDAFPKMKPQPANPEGEAGDSGNDSNPGK